VVWARWRGVATAWVRLFFRYDTVFLLLFTLGSTLFTLGTTLIRVVSTFLLHFSAMNTVHWWVPRPTDRGPWSCLCYVTVFGYVTVFVWL
jgi:hypothetical protein